MKIMELLKSAGAGFKKFYETRTILKIFLSIVVLAVLIYVFVSIPVWAVSENDIEYTASRELRSGESIALDAGKVELAQSGGKILSIDTENMIIEVEDTESRTTFSSAASGTAGTELALLSLSYLGEDNNLYEWNSYDNCTVLSTYELYKIENGVRIDLNFNEGESSRFYEYMPRKIGVARFEEIFQNGIDNLVAAGTLDETRAARFKTTLSLVYRRSLTEECYAVTYTGNPPTSAVTQLIELSKLVGYTQEELLFDAEEWAFTVTFTEPALFDVSIELTLENGELVAHMPSGSFVSGNDFYTIQNIKMLPNFGAVTSDEYEDGYIFVPDGSGALLAFNSYQAAVRDYERPMYDNDFFKDYYFMPEYGEELFMPVYGMLYGAADSAEKGFLAIAEEGARNGYIHVRLASMGADSSKYNKVYSSFDFDQYKRVKINGEYSDSSASYLVDTGMQNIDVSVRYKFFGKDVNYFELAKSYQSYLAENDGLTVDYADSTARMYLEVIGGLNLVDRFVGIPYNSDYSMTTYSELGEIMQSLEGVDYMLQYDGAFNDGINGKMNNEASLMSENGKKSELEELMSLAEASNIPFYLQTSFSKVWESGNGFRASTHAVRDFADDEAEFSRYMPAIGILSVNINDGLNHNSYYMVSPRYLESIVDSFIEDSDEYGSLAVADLAGMYLADYRFRDYVNGEEGDKVLSNSLEKLSENKDLALANPHIDKIKYGSVATDVSRQSSDYATFAMTIPFKQLVMNGLIEYTTEDVNLSSRNTAYFVLQAAELNAYPKFVVTAKNVDVLRESDFQYLYSAQYSLLEEKIKAVYEECKSLREQIGSSEITNHEFVVEGVYRTTYASGVSVLVNYNLYEVTLEDGTVLPAEGYLIKEVG